MWLSFSLPDTLRQKGMVVGGLVMVVGGLVHGSGRISHGSGRTSP